MIDINKLKEQQKDSHPAFGSYLECMTRTFFTGLAGFCLSFSGVYFTQKLLKNTLPYDRKYNILVCSIVGTVTAFKITKDRTKSCQTAWMSAEDKHTAYQD